MKLSYEDHEQISILTISGELTADQSDAFRRTCMDRLDSGIRDMVLNMEYLTLIDSVGLELLLWLQDETSSRHGQMRVVNPDHTVRKILQLTRLDGRFHLFENIETAARSLR